MHDTTDHDSHDHGKATPMAGQGRVASYIDQTLRAAFPDATLAVRDTTGTDDHFEVEVRSGRFAGLSRIDQHRLVYDALGAPVGRQIHALALRTIAT